MRVDHAQAQDQLQGFSYVHGFIPSMNKCAHAPWADELNRPASELSQATLRGKLAQAVRGSSASTDSAQSSVQHLVPRFTYVSKSAQVHGQIYTLSCTAAALGAEALDIIERLDVQLLPPSPGDVGWDVFGLVYYVRATRSTHM